MLNTKSISFYFFLLFRTTSTRSAVFIRSRGSVHHWFHFPSLNEDMLRTIWISSWGHKLGPGGTRGVQHGSCSVRVHSPILTVVYFISWKGRWIILYLVGLTECNPKTSLFSKDYLCIPFKGLVSSCSEFLSRPHEFSNHSQIIMPKILLLP